MFKQGGRNWLLARMMRLVQHDYPSLVRLVEAVDGLANMTGVPQYNGVDTDPDDLGDNFDDDLHQAHEDDAGVEEAVFCMAADVDGDGDWAAAAQPNEFSLRRVQQLSGVICSGIDFHYCLPAALGTGCTSLQHKVAALLHSLSLETASRTYLKQLLGSCAALCTDMGTEIGIADCSQDEFHSWFSQERNDAPLVDDDGFASDRMEPEPESPFVVSHTVAIPGILHILDNMTHDLFEKALEHGEAFTTHLGALCDLLCKRHHRERFVNHCLLRNPMGRVFAPMFDHEFHSIKEWRWGTVLSVLTWILPLKHPLKQFWSAARYGEDSGDWANDAARAADAPPGDESKKPRLDLALVTEAVHSLWLWDYMHMCVMVQTLIERIGWWASCCICHERLLGCSHMGEKDHATRQVLERRFQKCCGSPDIMGVHTRCPMSGLRAPECACGALEEVGFRLIFIIKRQAVSKDKHGP